MSGPGWHPYPLSGPEAKLKDGWFRLVNLDPGPRESPLQGTISPHPLSDAPKYEALSYAWGDAKDVANHVEISLNGKPFGITPELEKALRQLRHGESARTMWIDWICINQADLEERNAQVPHMRDIYRTADRVVAWIGDESEDSNRAMLFLKEMAMAKKAELRSIWCNGKSLGSDTSSECGDGRRVRQAETSDEQQQEDASEGESESQDEEHQESASEGESESQNEEHQESASEAGSGSRDEEHRENASDGESGHRDEEHQENASEGLPESTCESVSSSDHEEETPGQSHAKDGEDLPPDQTDIESNPEDSDGSDIQSAVDSEPDRAEERAKKRRARKEADAKLYALFMEEYEQNQKRRGHQVVGVPVLYYMFGTPYDKFFNESRFEDWVALDRLLERPWWSRTWVVQEVWLSTNAILQCGKMTLKWKTIQKAMDYSEGWDDMGYHVKNTPREKSWSTLKRRYGLAIHIAQQRLLGCTRLSDLLWNTWDREATDPRDKVFAVLGLLGEEKDGAHPPPAADYSKPVDQVYRETAAAIINSEDSLDLMLAAAGLDGEESNLPSWVPDWRRTGNDHRPALFINASRMKPLLYFSGSATATFFHGHGYSASGDAKMEVRFSDDLRIVHVRGFLFDTVQDIGPPHDESCSITDIIEGARSVLARSSSRGEQAEVAENELKTILKAGSFSDGGVDEFFRSEDQVVKNVMSKRRFFVTKHGHLCVGPARTEAGDSVRYIAGCNFPMVLRSKGEQLKLVGEAYVHKHMAGEALQQTPYGTPEWTEMAIC